MSRKLSDSPAPPGGTQSRLLWKDEALVALLALEGGHVGPELAGVAAPRACALKAPDRAEADRPLGLAQAGRHVLDADLLALQDLSLGPEDNREAVIRIHW